MSETDVLRALWLAVSDVTLPIAELRDEWLKFPGVHRRWSQYDGVYRNLLVIEQTLFECLEAKRSLLGSRPLREVCMIAEASLSNSKVLLEVGRVELALVEPNGAVGSTRIE